MAELHDPSPTVALAEEPEQASEPVDTSEYAYAQIVSLLEAGGRVSNVEPGSCTDRVRYAYWSDKDAGIRYRAHQLSHRVRGTWDNFAFVTAFRTGQTRPFAQILLSEHSCIPYDRYPELHLIGERPDLARIIGRMARGRLALLKQRTAISA